LSRCSLDPARPHWGQTKRPADQRKGQGKRNLPASCSQFDPKSDYSDAKSTKAAPGWSCLNVSSHQDFKSLVSLPDLRACAAFKDMLILRPGNSLSLTPVALGAFKAIAAPGGIRK
jgi:predicted RNA-binding protein with PUA-like domain